MIGGSAPSLQKKKIRYKKADRRNVERDGEAGNGLAVISGHVSFISFFVFLLSFVEADMWGRCAELKEGRVSTVCYQ